MEIWVLNWGIYGFLALLVVALFSAAVKIFREYERGVVFTLGRFTRVCGGEAVEGDRDGRSDPPACGGGPARRYCKGKARRGRGDLCWGGRTHGSRRVDRDGRQ